LIIQQYCKNWGHTKNTANSMKKVLSYFALYVFATGIAYAQSRITVEDFTTRPTFLEKQVTGINWMNDGNFYSALSENKVIRYDITTGQPVETVVDGTALSPQIEIEDYSFSADESMLLLQTNVRPIYRRSFTAEYYVYHRSSKRLQPLSANGALSYATFSPDGTKVAFVRENNLFFVTLSDMKEQQVTDDGEFNSIINGTTDWVYEEEFSFVVGFAWSPDSKKLAYYKFDESDVNEYNLQYWGNFLYPYDYRYKYPKAGEKNSLVSIWTFDLTSGKHIKVDIGGGTDIYVPRIKWTSNAGTLSLVKLNRLQNEMQLLHANAATGETKVILDEKTDTYFDIEILDVLYLRNGKEFLRLSEEESYMQLYLHDISGRLIRKITQGNFDVTAFIGADEKNKVIYYMSTEASPLERHLYSISFDGKKKTKLTTGAGVHDVNMSNDFQFYIDHHSSAKHPKIATLYRTRRNASVKVLERNETLASRAKEYAIAQKEFFTFTTDEGTTLNGYFLKPANFDSLKSYPLMIYQYSGPGSQEVKDAWTSSHLYFHQMLAQAGYIVAVVDPRGTGARGTQFKKVTYKQLGKYELEDLLAAGKHFASLSFIDANRMGIWGWSYGGYMSSLAMTKGAGTFKLGIAVAPVTNWRFYDTIYTERYLQTPQLNPGGYDLNSPLTYADKLRGKFLLVHGTGDDNVHVQNSIAFQSALINAGIHFDSFFYPDRHHGIQGGQTRRHLYTMMLDFIKENL
jgi:dipeptidyl-peptidase-4